MPAPGGYTRCACSVEPRRTPMIVRLATFASPTPDVRAEALRNLTERFQPALVAHPGFVAGYWAEAEDGRMFSITVWESEAGRRPTPPRCSRGRTRPRSRRPTGSKP